MKSRLVYVELKTGFSDNGPAWIGTGRFSKTGRTIYFNGQTMMKAMGTSGNFLDLESRNEYWVSGVKKDGTNRHPAGGGKIKIDSSVVGEYLKLVKLGELPKSKFEVVELTDSVSQVNILHQ